MPLVRILVDGYSLLHHWLELAPGKPRYSAAARGELIHWLRQYRDAIGTPISIVFDGAGPTPTVAHDVPSTAELEILYSKTGQTADDIIERVAARLVRYGDVMVVTNDFAEQDTIRAAGANSISCGHFVAMVHDTLRDMQQELKRHNQQENKKYRTG